MAQNVKPVRAFLAVEVDDEVRERLHQLSLRLQLFGLNMTWVKRDNLHLTLRFLGNCDPGHLENLAGELERGYAAVTPFDVAVQGLGVFPHLRRPGVLWAGVTGGQDHLSDLYTVTEEAVRAMGMSPDTKPYHPHLTLARARRGRTAGNLKQALEREHGFDGGAFRAGTVSLFRSRLTAEGPRYEKLRDFPF